MVYRPFIKAATCATTAFIVIKLATLFKVSFIVGSCMAFFSGTSLAVPLLGAFTGFGSVITAVFTCMIGHWAMIGIPSVHYLAYHIPGLFASAAWAYPTSKSIRLLLPLLCMMLFIAHPVGMYAFPYALYWLIPITCYLSKSSSLFAQALSSTFIAHAVGSVIWLYTMPMTSAAWLALIPVVAVERLCFALGMVILYQVVWYGIGYRKKMGSSYSKGFQTSL
ncbi:MAG: hypothetical protein ACHQVS_01185 [Candidatus Babeliales bacterium]